MPPNEPNSHVVTRRLTESWEIGQRQLYFYDFGCDKFSRRPSRWLLTADDSYGEQVEQFLNRQIETHLAKYLDTVDEGRLTEEVPWQQRRALILSVLFQPIRVSAGRGEGTGRHELRSLLDKSDSYFDQLAQAAQGAFRVVGGKLDGGQLFFPSVGLAALPLAGALSDRPAILFQPTSPVTFFACIPSNVPEANADEHLRSAMSSGLLSACSVGFTCDLVVVPPSMYRSVTEENLRAAIHRFRDASRDVERLLEQVNGFAAPEFRALSARAVSLGATRPSVSLLQAPKRGDEQ